MIICANTCALRSYITEASKGPGPGLDQVAQIMFGSRPGSGQAKMLVIKRHIENFGLPQAVGFSQRKVIRRCYHLPLVTQSGSGNKYHRPHFLGDFRSCFLPGKVLDKTLQTLHPTTLYRSSNTKITSHVLTELLNIS